MSKIISFSAKALGSEFFAYSNRYGAIGLSFLTPGYDVAKKQEAIQATLSELTKESLDQFERPGWGEHLITGLSQAITDGSLTSIEGLTFSVTIFEVVTGGIRIGTLGVHFLCMRWPDSGVGRIGVSDSLVEKRGLGYSDDSEHMWDIPIEQFSASSTERSLHWRTEFLTEEQAVFAVAPHDNVRALQTIEASGALAIKDLDAACAAIVSNKSGLCLAAARA